MQPSWRGRQGTPKQRKACSPMFREKLLFGFWIGSCHGTKTNLILKDQKKYSDDHDLNKNEETTKET